MQSLTESCVHCVVTSPPYWGLRDYGVGGQIGLEKTPAEYVSRLVEVFREVRRVLRDDGTLWLNLGDSYNGKNLAGIPWRVALALQDDGWYLRQDVIWHKPNPMPESVRDRCTKAHEYVFLMTKRERYFYDSAAIEEQAKWERWGNQTEIKKHPGTAGHLGGKSISELPIRDKKNRRSVWKIPTRPYKGAHFATMPPQLAEICIAAGSPVGGVVLDPFAGSGTTIAVAISMGRSAVGCELNGSYVSLAEQRIKAVANKLPLFVDTDC